MRRKLGVPREETLGGEVGVMLTEKGLGGVGNLDTNELESA